MYPILYDFKLHFVILDFYDFHSLSVVVFDLDFDLLDTTYSIVLNILWHII